MAAGVVTREGHGEPDARDQRGVSPYSSRASAPASSRSRAFRGSGSTCEKDKARSPCQCRRRNGGAVRRWDSCGCCCRSSREVSCSRAKLGRDIYRIRLCQPTTLGMRRRPTHIDILDKHHVTCPRCRCPEAVVLIDGQFNLDWQCVNCETRWPASDAESALLLNSTMKTIH